MLIMNKKISNEWVDIKSLGLMLHDKTVDESPEIDVKETDNINSSKKILGVNYTHREFTVNIVANYSNAGLLRDKINSLNSLLLGGFELRFRDNFNQKYKEVYLSSKISSEKITDSSYILTAELKSYNPFRYSVEETVDEFKRVTESRVIVVNNKGNFISKPEIVVKGSFSKLKISTEDSYIILSNFNGGVIKVNNDKLQIVNVKDDGREVNALSHWGGGFLLLKPGENDIKISGDRMNLDMNIKHSETYL